MSGSDEFYTNLNAMTEFERFSDFEAYVPLPDDWVVIAGDIEGSTAAIADGRYKTVNMLGAAVITAVLNQCGDLAVPFVFGGDGGSLAVPGHLAPACAEALRRLQAHSIGRFGLSLRAAIIPVQRLRGDGVDVCVRRFALNANNSLAMFAGGGIEHADHILKQAAPGDPDILRPDPDALAPDLDGLSCRWEPLSSTHGRMIALMVQPIGDNPTAVLQDVLQSLTRILDQDIPSHAPVNDRTLRFRWPPRGLWLEIKATVGARRWIRPLAWGLFTALVQKLCHWRRIKVGDYDGATYLEELKAQTDFRKYDGCLRTVLDCTEDQVEAIETWLAEAFARNRLVYGLHVDKQALMTCLVFSLARSEHIHFVDAAGGGFASASIGFKARLAAVQQEKSKR